MLVVMVDLYFVLCSLLINGVLGRGDCILFAAPSTKHQAPSTKHQAPSTKHQAP
jgi:hypothetical protein